MLNDSSLEKATFDTIKSVFHIIHTILQFYDYVSLSRVGIYDYPALQRSSFLYGELVNSKRLLHSLYH